MFPTSLWEEINLPVFKVGPDLTTLRCSNFAHVVAAPLMMRFKIKELLVGRADAIKFRLRNVLLHGGGRRSSRRRFALMKKKQNNPATSCPSLKVLIAITCSRRLGARRARRSPARLTDRRCRWRSGGVAGRRHGNAGSKGARGAERRSRMGGWVMSSGGGAGPGRWVRVQRSRFQRNKEGPRSVLLATLIDREC